LAGAVSPAFSWENATPAIVRTTHRLSPKNPMIFLPDVIILTSIWSLSEISA
jgi:hypothetical protein